MVSTLKFNFYAAICFLIDLTILRFEVPTVVWFERKNGGEFGSRKFRGFCFAGGSSYFWKVNNRLSDNYLIRIQYYFTPRHEIYQIIVLHRDF